MALGIPEVSDSCPIALALKRNGVKGAYVDGSTAEGKYKGHSFCTDLPLIARAFVKRFDNRKPTKPFRFILNTKRILDPSI